MQTPGPLEIVVILVVALLVFGPNKLPEIGRQVGKAVKEFRRFQSSFQEEVRDFVDPDKPVPSRWAGAAEPPPTPAAATAPGPAPEPIVDAEIVTDPPPPAPAEARESGEGGTASAPTIT